MYLRSGLYKKRRPMRHTAPSPGVTGHDPAQPDRLQRYLDAELVAQLRAAQPRRHAIFAACAQLSSARYTVSTYLPRRLVARQIATAGSGPWVEWVEGSLLFTDVSGSTALAERLTALGREGTEIVTDTLNSYFGTLIRIIQQRGGDLLTFGGDALLVLFTGPDHPLVATATAVQMLDEQSDFQRHVPGIGSFPMSMHIGVASGRVALVSAGQPHALRYSAMGATVNTVARAEGYGGKGELVLGPIAWSAVAPYASGVPVADGFVRLTELRYTPADQPAAENEPPADLTLAGIEESARQLERIAPYLPDTLLDRILADPQRPRVEADLRPVTVLFAQVRGLSELVETLPEEQAAAAVDAFLRPMQAAIQQYGGFLNKIDLADEGDKLLAIFGAPVAYEDHAERAARAALAMMAALPALEDKGSRGQGVKGDVRTQRAASLQSSAAPLLPLDPPLAPPSPAALALRIGLNTGNVFAGNVGTPERKEYTVMGDAVNVAARVMSKADWGETRCAAATAAMIGGTLSCSDPRQVYVKGKSEPLELLRLDGERSATPAIGSTAPLIGREAELAWLEAHLAGSLSGQGRAVYVFGEAGIGKSRLAAALAERAAERGAHILTVRCHSFNTNTPFAPWGDLLRDLCAIAPDDGQAARAAKLSAALEAAGIPADDWLPLMAELVRLDAEDNIIVRALDPQQRQARRFDIVLDLLRAAAAQGPETRDQGPTSAGPRPHAGLRQAQPADTWPDPASTWPEPTDAWPEPVEGYPPRPASDHQHQGLLGPSSFVLGPGGSGQALVILFDNLHWADEISLDLWEHVAANIDDVPILLVGLHRGSIAWNSPPDPARALALNELSHAASSALLDALCGADPLEADLRGQLIARAAGNPLFLEELLYAVRSDKAGIEALPDSLNGLLLARIDRLDERERTLLRVASVIGQRFPVGVLQSIHIDDQQLLIRQLSRLDSQELTSLEREAPERVHLFRHALMQEVAYQSLLYARRRELHRRIGEHLERRYTAELEQIRAEYSGERDRFLVQIGRNGSLLSRAARANTTPIFLLAHHYRLSDDPEHAVPYLLLAGHAARDDYANEQAIQYYRWALEALGDAPADPRSWEAREALGDVLATLGRYDEAQAEYAAILGVGGAEVVGAQRATPLPPAVAAEVLRSWGDALEKQGRYPEALEKFSRAEAIVQAHLNQVPPLILAAIYADMGLVYRRQGEYDRALATSEAGLARIRNDRRSAEDERIEADLQQQIGSIYGMRGQYDQARFHFMNALGAQEAIDDLYGASRTQNNLGYLAQLQSDYALAVQHYEQAEELARKISARYIRSSVQLNIAYAYYRLDRYAEAEAACHEVLALCEEMGERDGMAKAYNTLGLIAFNRGDYAEARRFNVRALEMHRELGSTYEEGYVQSLLAQIAIMLGDGDEAVRLADQAAVIGERLQTPQLIVEALAAQAGAHLHLADRPELSAAARDDALALAAELAGRAAAMADQLGSRLDYGQARSLAGEIAARRGEPFDEHFQAALEVFAAIASVFEQGRAMARYGAALAACNQPGAAAYLQQAEAIFRHIGATGELERLPHTGYQKEH